MHVFFYSSVCMSFCNTAAGVYSVVQVNTLVFAAPFVVVAMIVAVVVFLLFGPEGATTSAELPATSYDCLKMKTAVLVKFS